MAIAAAGIGLASSLLSSRAKKKAASKASGRIAMRDVKVDSSFGSATVGPGGITSAGGVGSEAASPFASLTQDFLSQIPGQSIGTFGIGPEAIFEQARGLSETQEPFLGAASNFGAAGQNILQQLQGFNQEDFTNQAFDRLNFLAERGEQNAASSLGNRLFARGRLGGDDTLSGTAFGGLARGIEEARTGRGLEAIGLGEQRAKFLGDQAVQFTGAGVDTALGGAKFGQSQIDQLLASITGAGAASGIQTGISGSLLNQAITTQAGVQNAQLGERQSIQDALQLQAIQQGVGTNQATLAAATVPGTGSALASFGGSLAASFINKKD